MDGDSRHHFRCDRDDFPEDTQLFDWDLSDHRWHNGLDRVLQSVKETREKRAGILN
jgi:hypothetical protein